MATLGPLPRLWEYHVRAPSALNKHCSSHGVAFERNGLRHIWTGGLKAPGNGAFEQTALILDEYGCAIASSGATVQDHAVRTWFFVSDIDAEYAALVEARKRHFDSIGLTPETHYISSTGIAGRGMNPKDRIHLDAYAIGGLAPEQVRFLTAPQFLGPTHLYGVTFERGTRITYGDRSHVYVSGTASIDPAGTTLHVGEIGKQCQRAIENTEALLRDAGGSLSDVVQLIAYVRDPADGAEVVDFLDRHCGKIPRIVVRAAVCRPNWLVEFECIALLAQDRAGFPEF
jgi:enamine deaminase RidA (YjgF/YER057c/UK114 family)